MTSKLPKDLENEHQEVETETFDVKNCTYRLGIGSEITGTATTSVGLGRVLEEGATGSVPVEWVTGVEADGGFKTVR